MNSTRWTWRFSIGGTWLLSVIAVGLAAGSLWVGWLAPQRAFLNDYRSGLQAYLQADWGGARERLGAALRRKPQHAGVRQLLVRIAVEEGLRQYKSAESVKAAQSLQAALPLLAPKDPTRKSLEKLMDEISSPRRAPLRDIPALLDGLSVSSSKPPTAPSDSERPEWIQAWTLDRDQIRYLTSQSQELWLSALENETRSWRYAIYGGVALLSFSGLLLVTLVGLVLHQFFGRRGVLVRMLESHYLELFVGTPGQNFGRNSLAALPRPQGSGFHRIDFIEAELVNPEDSELAKTVLKTYLEGEDPWLRARAATAINRLDGEAALAAAKKLIQEPSSEARLAGVWAMGEIASPESVELLGALLESQDAEIHKTALRHLIQLSQRETLSSPTRDRLQQILEAIRLQGRWVV
jgi:hypothetical protein